MSVIVTAALTAFFGVVVFVAGQFVQKFLLEPIQEQRKVMGRIIFAFTFYANIFHVADPIMAQVYTPEQVQDARNTLRSLAGELRTSMYAIPFYKFWAAIQVVPNQQTVSVVSKNLVGWSNSLSGNTREHWDAIRDALNLKY